MQVRRRFVVSAALAAFAGIASCREPTQITLEVTTDAQCPAEPPDAPSLVDTFIAAGAKLSPDELVAANITTQCTPEDGDNLVGTLVLIPGDGDGSTVEVVVIGGVDSHGTSTQATTRLGAEACTSRVAAGESIDGMPCIVAKRRLGFVDHKKLFLPIKLDKRCIGVECEQDQTCFEGGCVDAAVVCDDAGNCANPQGTGGGGTGAGGDGGAGGGAGCVVDCNDACPSKSGVCVDGACQCTACDPTSCAATCAETGDVGSCSPDDVCLCQNQCDQAACTAQCNGTCSGAVCLCDSCDEVECMAQTCPGGGTGQCLGPVGMETCTCVGGTCMEPSCDTLACGLGQEGDCISQDTCACTCHNDLCNTDCGIPGGECNGNSCSCNPPCSTNDCAATCMGIPGTVPQCINNACQCICMSTECAADCIAANPSLYSGGVCDGGGTCDCTEIPMTTTGSSGSSASSTGASSSSSSSASSASSTSAASSSSSGMMCEAGMCSAQCVGMGFDGGTCIGVSCECFSSSGTGAGGFGPGVGGAIQGTAGGIN
jgi:hypothetical protein